MTLFPMVSWDSLYHESAAGSIGIRCIGRGRQARLPMAAKI